jgi:hypothetical protein
MTKRENEMNTKTLRAVLVAGIVLLSGALPALATPIKWTLSDVKFTDGATASGSFFYDGDTKKGSLFNVSTSAGILSAFHYEPATSGLFTGGGAGPNNFILMTNDGRRYLNFSFLDPLSNAGGTLNINLSSGYECLNCNPSRHMVSGSVTTLSANVPEPGTLAIVMPALGMLGWMARRRNKKSAQA